ncbi:MULTISPECIES: DUF6377 domain-containing protein [Bacteroides]|jgi:hypothetical protein|uniref:Transcriptional regulator n=1 Tax=Bacteroides ovatus TaxID=28116 RepID=A0A413EYZ7_BACOV|nr:MULTISPECIES: DUF6377 domain-containing protein [Bacteroides]MBV3310936.1 helix-turn-helix transcriptional regulator [Bacteroides ovatus]MCS2297075.1 helix-turn-helix transcriptional regulator [Bacteroides ovatus]RGE81113.1 transcriptional regulator [Bacteroides sp. AF32-8BH]RGX13324.1 transcriptional regulator [Bacteroides ovatus]RGX28419.1 transcriptional regulator [Bacteroides ovatus]
MKKNCLLCFLLFFSCHSAFAGESLDSLLNVLDKTIKEADTYVQIKENKLHELKKKARKTPPFSVERYHLNNDIYLEYKAYSSDSALHYLNENMLLARQLNDKERELKIQLELSYLLSSIGMYMEAADILNLIDRQTLPSSLLGYYYTCYEHVYFEAGAAQPRYKMFASRYAKLSHAYRDSMQVTLDPSSATYLWLRETQLREAGKYDEALEFSDRRLAEASFGTPQYALVAYQRFRLFESMGKKDEHLYYLVLSAISDVRSAIKEQSSLMVLAQELNSKGDLKRAYDYINFSWEISQFYKTRLRSWMNITPLSMINGNYQDIIKQQNRELLIYITCVALLALLLVIALIYIYRQMKALSIAKKGLQEVNERLFSLNEELEEVNCHLRSTNLELSESNLIKEAYIARFFKLCSVYVDRLQAYRKLVNKKLQRGQVAELLKMTHLSNDIVTVEVQELYANFDSAFLHLFPNFVESLNALLLPEEQIVLKPDELLNTELRIFALIRLGIKDSSQIAELLHYSVNTIYNYRSRVKTKARVSRDDFEDLVAKIR